MRPKLTPSASWITKCNKSRSPCKGPIKALQIRCPCRTVTLSVCLQRVSSRDLRSSRVRIGQTPKCKRDSWIPLAGTRQCQKHAPKTKFRTQPRRNAPSSSVESTCRWAWASSTYLTRMAITHMRNSISTFQMCRLTTRKWNMSNLGGRASSSTYRIRTCNNVHSIYCRTHRTQ